MIQLRQISKHYGSKSLFDGIDMLLPGKARIGLVGANGAGKTTLLNIICGLDTADSGRISLGKDTRIGYLPQEANPRPEPTVVEECMSGHKELFALHRRLQKLVVRLEQDHSPEIIKAHEELSAQIHNLDGFALQARAQKLLSGLGFSDKAQSQDPRQLSGGWRMRLELAKLLLAAPQVLILDEPTNHLDLPAMAWVERWLQQFTGLLIFVSHDRSLLDRLADHILYLHTGSLRLYPGNFQSFLEQRELQAQSAAKQLEGLQKKRSQHQAFVDRFGAKASKASQARSRVKQIARLRALEEGLAPEQAESSIHLTLAEPMPSGRTPLDVSGLSIGYGQESLASQISFQIERGQKVAVIGANGIGKSTLMKTLAAQIPKLAGGFDWGHQTSMAYFAQDQGDRFADDTTLLDTVLYSGAEVGERQARQILGALLFREDSVYKPRQVLSGGEKNRLGLACLLAQPANMLLMDEPTNHLDMASVEVLTQALQGWGGTLLFVSHDRSFIDALATHILVMLPDGRSRIFLGKLDDYQRAAAASGFPDVLSDQPSADEGSSATRGNTATQKAAEGKVGGGSPDQRKQLRKAQNRLKKLEGLLTDQQAKVEAAEQALGSTPGSDHQALIAATAELDQQRALLDELETEWLELSTLFED